MIITNIPTLLNRPFVPATSNIHTFIIAVITSLFLQIIFDSSKHESIGVCREGGREGGREGMHGPSPPGYRLCLRSHIELYLCCGIYHVINYMFNCMYISQCNVNTTRKLYMAISIYLDTQRYDNYKYPNIIEPAICISY